MQLVLDSKGLKLSKKSGVFQVTLEDKMKAISPGKISSIAITANVELSTEAILLAIDHQIPILFFDRIGKPKGRLWSPYFSSLATLRRQQIQFAESLEATSWMINLFELKTDNQLENISYLKKQKSGLNIALTTAANNIRRNSRKLDDLRPIIIDKARNSMMGIEGSMARIYWQALGNTVPRAYRFDGRSRQPAKDIFNAALNYLYGMLYTVVEGGILAAGLDPHLGILHVDAYDKPTLAFDLIEPFRPWVDRLLLEECFNQNLDSKFFSNNQYGIFFNKHGKAHFIPKFNDLMRSKREYLQVESTVQNHIYFLAATLAQRIRTL